MSRELCLSADSDCLIQDLEKKLLSHLEEINFHKSNFAVMENMASYFEKPETVKKFSADFIGQVYKKLIGPATQFGYYFSPSDSQDRNRLFRTSSAIQYHGNDQRFKMACQKILGTIDALWAQRSGEVSSITYS